MIARVVCFVVCLSLNIASSTWAIADESWLRGDSASLQIRIHGRIEDSEGNAAKNFEIKGQVYQFGTAVPIALNLNQDRFECWVPVHQFEGTSLRIDFHDRATDECGSKSIEPFEFRRAAIDGLVLKTQKSTRPVEIKVIDKDKAVANAIVILETRNSQMFRGSTNELGIAKFNLLPTHQLHRLTAWTEDYRMGGYNFSRAPAQDAALDSHTISLSPCRELKLRCVDESSRPVSNFEFELNTGTPSPDRSRLKTNETGEVTYPWFPDSKSRYIFIESHSDNWQFINTIEKVENGSDIILVRLKEVKRKERKHIAGRLQSKVASIEGICLKFASFQGERDGYTEQLYAFTDAQGNFSASILPDATYCVHAIDTQWVSNITSLILYDSATSKASSPELELVAGERVQIRVTSGPDRKPLANAKVRFISPYVFSWMESKDKRIGQLGPDWSNTTNENGIAETSALPGILDVTASVGGWWTKRSMDVSPGKANTLELHRAIDSKQRVTGKLLPEKGTGGSVSQAEIVVASLGSTTKDEQRLKSDVNGEFQFETLACPIGIFASTVDSKAAGYIVLHDLDQLKSKFDLLLKGTQSYYGKLLDSNGKPLVGSTVSAKVSMTVRKPDIDDPSIATSFTVKTLETKTDEHGDYVIENVPLEMATDLSVQSDSPSARTLNIRSVFLEAGDGRPVDITRIGKQTETVPLPWDKRLTRQLNDSRVMGYPLIVILSESDPSTSDFVNSKFLDYDTNPDVDRFLQWWINLDSSKLTPQVSGFLNGQGWTLPDKGKVVACMLDVDGREKGRIQVDVSDSNADQVIRDFMKAHLPPRLDAIQMWNEAFAEAKASQRVVWARLSGRYCGPCFKLARWIDRHKEILERDYVMLKNDSGDDADRKIIRDRIMKKEIHGIPFYAMFNPDQEMILDSECPLGNIGFPSDFDRIKFLRKMLLATRKSITDKELDHMLADLVED